jgi:hypothetical protein
MARTTFGTFILFLALCPLTGAAGCGDDDASGDTDSDTDTDTDGDTDTDADTDTDSDTDSDTDTDTGTDTGSVCDADLLPGVWLSTDYSVQFLEDLSYEAAGAPNLEVIDVYGQAAVDGCEISFTDATGDYACPAEQVGVYSFTVDATTLSFVLVSDACAGRSIPLDGAVLARQ